MEEIYTEIVKVLEEKNRCVLATLINRLGSAPRAVGAKYLIYQDGSSLGSIGGGCVEAEVWQKARKIMEEPEREILHFDLTSEQLAEGGLVCGGNVDIFLEPIEEDFLNIYQEVARIREKGGFAVIATLIKTDLGNPNTKNSKILVKPSGEKIGSLLGEGEVVEKILSEDEGLFKEKKPKILIVSPPDHGRMEVLLEPIFSDPTVYIFGGGHISEQLAPLIKKVHFRLIVIDDREIFANRGRFPEADEVIVANFENCFEGLNINGSSYIVIVTRGHLYDGFVLEQAIKSNARYIGMIGSKKKIQILYKNLTEKGISERKLSQVHAPIGIDINSETPEEIAVSIVAELIKSRAEDPDKRLE